MSEFWDATEKLEIYLDDYNVSKDYIEYPLYEAIFVFALKRIFNMAAYFGSETEKAKYNELEDFKGNIYTFLGARGSGKTTALRTFCSILKKINEDDTRRWWLDKSCDNDIKRKLMDKSFHFYVLDMIDASLLEYKEDLFELILVTLYNQFVRKKIEKQWEHEEYYSNSDIMQINKAFEDTLTKYRTIRDNNSNNEYSVSSTLRFLSTSTEINKSLKVLIKKLIALFGKNCNYEYVVIALDDLDLNLIYGYDMLEQLQKYFFNYKIIILVAVDYKQMQSICREHFHELMPLTAKEAEIQYGYDSHSKELAKNYMTKVFPLSQRLFMPDMTNLTAKIQIKIGENRYVLLNHFILVKIAKTMGLYLDIISKERHVLKPDTVRDLVMQNEFLHDLEPFKIDQFLQEKRETRRTKSQNNVAVDKILQNFILFDKKYERFRWEIEELIAQTKLNTALLSVYHRIINFSLNEKAIQLIWQYEYDISYENIDNVRDINEVRNNYSYGELLQIIYNYEQKGKEYRALASCFRVSYSLEAYRKYLEFLFYPDKIHRFNCKRELSSILGNSFSNSWLSDILPTIIISGNNRLRKILYAKVGFVENPMYNQMCINFSTDILLKLDSIDITKWKPILKQWLEDTELVNFCECIQMLLIEKTGVFFDTAQIDMNYDYPRNDQIFGHVDKPEADKKVIQVTTNIGNYKIDVLGFIGLMLDYDHQKIKNQIIEEINWCVYQCIEENFKNNYIQHDILKKYIKELVDELSMLRMIKEEERIVFPFYNIDVSYGIFRNIREMEGKIYNGTDIFHTILTLYRTIEDNIKLIEDSYHMCDESLDMNYLKKFRHCPHIEMFETIAKKEKKVGTNLPDMLNRALSQMLWDVIPEKTSDDEL